MYDINDNKNENRYELRLESTMAIADYRLDGNRLSIMHVEVPEALRGKGIAAELMAHIVKDAKERNLTIIPVCPYAATYLKRNQPA